MVQILCHLSLQSENIMQRSIATVSVSGTLPEKLHAIAAAGFDGIELFENDLLYYPGTPADVRRLCADLGLQILLFQPFRDFEGESRERFAANLERARRKFALMHELGCDNMLLCSNVSSTCSDNIDLQISDLGALAELAQREGITVGYEALAWGRHVSRFREAWQRVAAVDNPALGLVLDSFHILARGDRLGSLEDIPVEKISFLQLADAPLMKMDVLEWSRHYRCFPGQGELAVVEFARELTAHGYRGPWSLEVFNDGFRAVPGAPTAKDGWRSLLWLEEQTRIPQMPNDAQLFHSAPLPTYQGVEFIEFATDETGADALGEALRPLGFTHAGEHRSKQVDWWRNGGANIIINHQPHSWADDFHQRHGISLCAMAWRVKGAAQLLQRAQDYGYPLWQEKHGPDERALPAICAPDGSLIYLIEADEQWHTDFHLRNEQDSGQFSGVDHLALGLVPGSRQNWVMFFRAVFGFELQGAWSLADPYGLVRSQVVHSPCNRIRLPLNISRSLDTQLARSVACYHGSGLQHAAFACDDILSIADDLGARGMARLPIPENYYHDLQARYSDSEALLARLRPRQILYERDEQGGEFLHLYTLAFEEGRFSFELVERRANYQQYGATNAAVRLAAMRRTE